MKKRREVKQMILLALVLGAVLALVILILVGVYQFIKEIDTVFH